MLADALDTSFDHITRHELVGRKIVALGAVAAGLCIRHGIAHEPTCHPSRRSQSNEANVADIAAAKLVRTLVAISLAWLINAAAFGDWALVSLGLG